MYPPRSQSTITRAKTSLLLLLLCWFWSSSQHQHHSFFFGEDMVGGSFVFGLPHHLLFPIKLVQASLLPQRRYWYRTTVRTTTAPFASTTTTTLQRRFIIDCSPSLHQQTYFRMGQKDVVRRSARLRSLMQLSSARQDGNDDTMNGEDGPTIVEESAPPSNRGRPSRRVQCIPPSSVIGTGTMEEEGTDHYDKGGRDNDQATTKIDGDKGRGPSQTQKIRRGRGGGQVNKENVQTQNRRRTKAKTEHPVVELVDRKITTTLQTLTPFTGTDEEPIGRLNGCLPRHREMTIRNQNPLVQYVMGYVRCCPLWSPCC